MRHPLSTASLLAAACSMGGGASGQSITASGNVTVNQQPVAGPLGTTSPAGTMLQASQVDVGSSPSLSSGRLALDGGATADVGFTRVGAGSGALAGVLEVEGFGTVYGSGGLELGELGGRGTLRVSDGGVVDLGSGSFSVGGPQNGVGGGNRFAVSGSGAVVAGAASLGDGSGVVGADGLFRIGGVVDLGQGGSFDLEVAQAGRLEAGSLVLGEAFNPSSAGSLTLAGTAAAGGTVEVNAGSRLRFEGGRLDAFRLDIDGGRLEGSGTVNGEVRLLSSASGRSLLRLAAGETLNVRNTSTIAFSSDNGQVENAGTLDVGTWFFFNQNKSNYFGRGGTFRGGGFQNTGQAASVDLLAGDNAFDAAFSNGQGARLTVTGGATGTFQRSLDNDGQVRVDPGSRLTVVDAYSGSGDLLGGGEAVFLGGFNAGNSPGVINVGLASTFASTSTYELELGGTDRSLEEYDAVNFQAGGSYDFQGGALEVSLFGGFAPELGDEFEIFRFESFAAIPVTGGFGEVILAELANGLSLDVSNLLVDGTITVVPEPGSVGLLLGGTALLLRRRRIG